MEMTRAKAESHGKEAQYWDRVHNILSLTLIFLSTFTTISTLLPISQFIAACLGGVTTLVAAVNGFLSPSSRRQQQMEASRGFRALMLKMVRVELERDYEELWKEYNKEILSEPFLPSKFKVIDDPEFSMSPEFLMVVSQKEAEVRDMTSDLELGSSASIKINRLADNSLLGNNSQSAESTKVAVE